MFIKMKPICDCGHIFKQVTIGRGESCFDNTLVNPVSISPTVCPSCGAEIEGVQTQICVGEKFEYDEQKYYKGGN